MDRTEGTGIGLALIGHAAVFGALSASFLTTPNPVELKQQPIEVSLTDEVALESMSQVPDAEVPAAQLSEVEAPVEPDTAPPEPADEPEQAPQPRQQPPAPAPRPDPRPAEKAEPRRPTPPAPKAAQRPREQPRRPTGRLDGLEIGRSDTPSRSESTTPPAATLGPQVRSALVAEIRRQLKPHWTAPTGADADRLVTILRVRLNRDGSLAARPQLVEQTGVTPSNRAQTELHAERAIRAVELAAPFRLPDEYYDAWRVIEPSFDRRLSL
ncbi:cell envelope biogenesis protein TolA [Sphingosinithalassobacter sp. CS137]|uniref:cell envelope biogenesis protein TolA n=1 Tax=Sphingosinithalassobacter sp. CS137 TaxID=2762748 RepID=UPI00165E8868|nr:cell envelope biogenesis protein TolA [Sphingosinithalassobacter sp. CS137]